MNNTKWYSSWLSDKFMSNECTGQMVVPSWPKVAQDVPKVSTFKVYCSMEDPIKRELKNTERQLEEIEKSGNRWLSGAFIRFGIRWTVLIVLYALLWQPFPWIKWTLILSVPLGIYSFRSIMQTQDKLADVTREVREKLREAQESIERMDEEE